MLASIRGTVIQKSDFSVVIDCNGFGVEVLATRRAADLCKVDGQAFLYTYLQISDAGIALYGFADETERRLFKLMILTKGVGGKINGVHSHNYRIKRVALHKAVRVGVAVHSLLAN